ncbi:hypothetical protein [uncultured Sphingomonas sp.]|uniref:hypothetical protein n=1 Tax=uncultured Sphingomonas sp. TaxID=158754 RepID=UPI002639F7D4|nr:hypothetical protein [uncultured Sphingomonas sp.]
MSATPDMPAALAEMERIMDDLHDISRRRDEARKSDLVRLRRSLADQMGVIAGAAAQSARLLGDEALAREFRRRFSAVRSAVALHQATWPAVTIDEGGAPYRESAIAVRQTNEAFLGWMRATLGIGPTSNEGN